MGPLTEARKEKSATWQKSSTKKKTGSWEQVSTEALMQSIYFYPLKRGAELTTHIYGGTIS